METVHEDSVYRDSLEQYLALVAVSGHAQQRSQSTTGGRGYPDTAALQRILIAEDLRGTGKDGINPLLDGLRNRADTMLRRVAIRGLGRLQRPIMIRDIAAALGDAVPAIRAEAANAIAQSLVRIKRNANDPGQADVKWAATTLAAALDVERDRTTGETIAESLGRLPFGDSVVASTAESAILHHAAGRAGFGSVRGLYWIAQNRPTTGGLSPNAILLVKGAARQRDDAPTRRVAVLTLGLARALDSTMIATAMKDPDDQVRRSALAGVSTLSPAYRADVVKAAFADPSQVVRIAAVTAARVGSRTPDCLPIIAAIGDRHPYVSQMAIDALAMPCADSVGASKALMNIMDESPGNTTQMFQMQHAIVSLAKRGNRQALQMLGGSSLPEMQLAFAEAAAIVGDTALLLRYAHSTNHNAGEAAIAGLSRAMKHRADSTYIWALQSTGYQVVMAAAKALAGSTDPGALPALINRLDRLTDERRENSRDPRIAVLTRIGELGARESVSRLAPYLADFDSTVADSAAHILGRWTGTTVAPYPKALPVPEMPLAKTFLAKSIQLRVTTAGGAQYTINLFNNEAPATVARIVKLAREHYFDNHVFQRVEPNFVVQGGGPDATEYVGDAQFMRDEVAWRSHMRGTLGISSRGRDTGDAQWFFNLIDNTRLDHEYTVFGEVVLGEDVVERILSGGMIKSVEVVEK